MNYKSEKILIIGKVQRSRRNTSQLAAGGVHSRQLLNKIVL
jgi:hypothetical protein